MWLLLLQTSFKPATVFHSIALHDLICLSFEATSTVSYATSLDLTIFELVYVCNHIGRGHLLTHSINMTSAERRISCSFEHTPLSRLFMIWKKRSRDFLKLKHFMSGIKSHITINIFFIEQIILRLILTPC